ncbi:MAG: glycerol-3-phosphate 1-O-acyltransferase PlsY [Clostridia bacterium]|nr:glycerol-3-phosphate 1-O-acyltransferase PlsY [Clostridia bacterium]
MLFNINDGGLISALKFSVDWQFYVTFMGLVLLLIIGSYLFGSINSSIIISKLLYHDDIRKHGSGNAGMTNMLRTYGKGAAGLTLLGDMLKTALAIVLGGVLFGFNYAGGVSMGDGYCYVAGLFAVLGHIFPIYYGFKGGKGVLATSTMALILTPIPFLILFVFFVIIVWISKYVSLGSVTVAILYPVLLHGYFTIMFPEAQYTMPGLISFSAIMLALLIVWCHRGNLKRISNRTERKISFKKKPNPNEENKND